MKLSKEQLVTIIKAEIGEAALGELHHLIRIVHSTGLSLVLDEMPSATEDDKSEARARFREATEACFEAALHPGRKLLDSFAERIADAIEDAESDARQ